jgi:hypothetical protein
MRLLFLLIDGSMDWCWYMFGVCTNCRLKYCVELWNLKGSTTFTEVSTLAPHGDNTCSYLETRYNSRLILDLTCPDIDYNRSFQRMTWRTTMVRWRSRHEMMLGNWEVNQWILPCVWIRTMPMTNYIEDLGQASWLSWIPDWSWLSKKQSIESRDVDFWCRICGNVTWCGILWWDPVQVLNNRCWIDWTIIHLWNVIHNTQCPEWTLKMKREFAMMQ